VFPEGQVALPSEKRPLFDSDFSTVLRRAVAQTVAERHLL